jgi:AbrB family looped-hinge helix DNA binding protein
MYEVKLSTNNQIVIPRELREALGIKAGDKLLAVPRRDIVILMRRPKNYADALAGIGKGFYSQEYLAQERESW